MLAHSSFPFGQAKLTVLHLLPASFFFADPNTPLCLHIHHFEELMSDLSVQPACEFLLLMTGLNSFCRQQV